MALVTQKEKIDEILNYVFHFIFQVRIFTVSAADVVAVEVELVAASSGSQVSFSLSRNVSIRIKFGTGLFIPEKN